MRLGQPFQMALGPAVEGLTDKDRRLAHEIASGVLRRRRVIDHRLRPMLKGRWSRLPDDLRDLLRIGAYQLGDLDRVPAYAAVETTVELSKRVGGDRGAGLVNAVLRRLGGEPFTPDAEPSHPDWLVARWLARFGTEATTALIAHNDRRPPLVLQPVNWSIDRLRAALEERGLEVTDAPFGLGLTVASRCRVASLPGFDEGGFIVQDSAQARTIEFAELPAGAVVWDACAAPGGKSVMLARSRRVVSSDMNSARMGRLRQTITRTAPSVQPIQADAGRPPFRHASIEAVWLDAPCSATGTIARHPDARWRLSPARIESLAILQRELLTGVAPVVRHGGILIYSTCSLEPEENQSQVDRFLADHSEFERTRADLLVFPPDAGTDGAFAARLRRVA